MADRIEAGQELVVAELREGLRHLDTQSWFKVKESYSPEDIEGLDYARDLGEPGGYPFTRGTHRQGYRSRLWTRRLFVGLPTAEETNRRWKYLIERGQTGLCRIPDNPTAMGIDSDHPYAKDQAGLTGTPYWAVQELEKALDGIALEGVSIDQRCPNSLDAANSIAQFILVGEKRGLPVSQLRGSTINDPLHSHICTLFNTVPARFDLKMCVDVIEYCTKNMPLFYPLCPAGYDLRESGINTVQELAFLFGEVIEYLTAAIKRGVKFEDVARKIVFSFSGEIDFFETAAKLRAARRMWAKIARERFGAEDPRCCRLLCSLRTAGASLTAQQPLNNVARLAIEALAGVLGGVNSMELCGYDEAISLPSEDSMTVSLAIQQIIAHESNAANVADPLGGSYYVEWLTNKIEGETWELLKKIEDMGGMLAAFEKGWIKQEVDKTAIEQQQEIEERRKLVIGVNEFIIPKEREIPVKRYRHEDLLNCSLEDIYEEHQKRIKQFRETRDTKKVKEALEHLRKMAESGENENLIPHIVEAYRAYATRGEISGVIREAYGHSYDPFNVISYPF